MRPGSFFAAAILACLLAGCAAQVISSSARTVVIKARTQDVASAQALADVECAKHERFARLASRSGPYSNEFVFDCVQ